MTTTPSERPAPSPYTAVIQKNVTPITDIDSFEIQESHWKTICSEISRIRSPMKWLANIGWTMLGFSGASFFAWLPWRVTVSQLPIAGQLKYDWVSPLMIQVCIFGGIVGAVFLFLSWQQNRGRDDDSNAVLRSMNEVHPVPPDLLTDQRSQGSK